MNLALFLTSLFLYTGLDWGVTNMKENLEAGLITSKTFCLIESLLGYRSGLHALFLSACYTLNLRNEIKA